MRGPVEGYIDDLDRVAPGRIAALYLVGGLALGDFSPRMSNVDLVVVADPPLESHVVAALKRCERRLERAGRPPAIWYAGWDELAERATPSGPALDTPLTRAILSEDAVAVVGPDWPVVAYEESQYRAWCRLELESLATAQHGLLVMRHDVAPLVLQAARLAHGAVSGRVVSKTEAGEAARSLVPPHFRRILHDATGYRGGATTSMYWGPFERKYDALRLLPRLVAAVSQAPATKL